MTPVPAFGPSPEWMLNGECSRRVAAAVTPEQKREAADVMYPHSKDTAGIDAAKAVCAVCEARAPGMLAECLDWAITNHEAHGVLGGMTPDERATLIRRMKRAGQPVPPKPLKPIEHGTDAGAKAHSRRGEPACELCAEAARVAKAARAARRTKVRRGPAEHGTARGYRSHFAHGEPACDECKAAERKRTRERRDAARKGQAA